MRSSLRSMFAIALVGLGLLTIPWGIAEAALGQIHDDLTYHFLGTSVIGLGDALIALPPPAEAFSANPAGLGSDRPLWALHAVRVSHRDLYFQRLNALEQYSDRERYVRDAVGTETLIHIRPLGRWGNLALSVMFQHEGRFQRVNSEGHQINTFPRNLWAWGIGYSVRVFDGFRVGIDARRVRVKPLDEDPAPLGWGTLYSVGMSYALGSHFRIGLARRNLTRGLSLDLPDLPTQVAPQTHLSVALERLFEDRLRLAAGWSFPAHEGMRIGLGAELASWPWLRLQGGYVRDVVRRPTRLEDLDAQEIVTQERLWKKEGVTLGAVVLWSDWMLAFAWAPQLVPQAQEGESLRVVTGQRQIALSLVHRGR